MNPQLPVLVALWLLSPSNTAAFSLIPTTIKPSLTLALPLFAFLSLSRLGLWIFDLTTQQLTQTLVPATSRSTFSGVENSLVSFFELGNYVAALALSKPEHFRWLAAGSVGVVAVSTVAYAVWVRGRRGHLVHWERVGAKCGCGRKERVNYEGRL